MSSRNDDLKVLNLSNILLKSFKDHHILLLKNKFLILCKMQKDRETSALS
jgi:hypothetical protein